MGLARLVLQLLQNMPGTGQHLLGQARQLGDLDTVAAVGTAGDDLPQEDDILAPCADGDVIVADAGQLALQRRQLVIVGGEQGLGPQLFRVGAVLQHRPGNGHAVKGRGAPADLVQNQQTVRSGGLQNIADLRHLHHEGGLSGGQVVAGADAGENAIHHADAGGPSGNKGADLRHQHDQRHLTHVGGFTGHVGAGDDGHPVILFAHVRIVGDKHAVPPHLLHHGVAAIVNFDDAGLVHHRAAVIVLHRHSGQ